MVNIEIDGKPLQVDDGKMLIEAADEAGIPIPRFCYHKKLSIAANCRMCLVEVEKAAKPLPACATPVTDGMRVYTRSAKALTAQKGVMEFLLINHPLDCPICDQGGECELQEVAMGYGRDISRYQEKKRVVKDKNIGPLIATDMTRCIHCTRCVRFGQEIAGLMELGATGRGEHMEIGTYIEQSLVSEMSGNVIDLCPVGALTSKPFRYSARAWELAQRDSVAPHDSIGSNLHLHVRDEQVMRVVPRENEAINEMWISDRDRYSYTGLNSAERLQTPRIKQNGVWQETDWQTALDFAVQNLRKAAASHGAQQLGALGAPHCTLEEMYLLQKLLRGLGSQNVDHRLRQSDFGAYAPQYPWLGQSLAQIEELDSALLIGSNVRKEQPIAAHRLRKAALRGAQVMLINSVDYDFNFPVEEKIIAAPHTLGYELAGVAKALCELDKTKNKAALDALAQVAVSDVHRTMANRLKSADNASLLLGNSALAHPQLGALHALAGFVARLSGAKLGYLPQAGNSVGGWLAGMLPERDAQGKPVPQPGLNARTMLEQGLKAYVLLNMEPEFDCANPAAALHSLNTAEFVVTLTPYATPLMESYADVMLPVTPFSETPGTFVNAEGRWQEFNATVRPLGEARPAWKVLRVMGNLFDLPGFDYVSAQEINRELRTLTPDLNALGNGAGNADLTQLNIHAPDKALTRVGHVPMHSIDNIVRRSDALQQCADAEQVCVRLNAADAEQHGLTDGVQARVLQDKAEARLTVRLDARVPDGAVLIAAGVPGSEMLGAAFGPVTLERVT
ncbi:MAG: NADH-quinone oxidoreductase subunit NuoG [Gammaproteobacteria bacterium]|nr:NADH-quinone oxidoreductase subunit NuoG [Gammaproteobacteria bacterium]